jgi:hypothetical protein
MIATCQKCGNSFNQDEPWKKICLPCWQKSKRQEKGFSYGDDSELLSLRRENLVLRQQLRTYQLFQKPEPRIEPEMLRRLTMLCHPDRHGNSEASTRATKWLLGQRV